MFYSINLFKTYGDVNILEELLETELLFFNEKSDKSYGWLHNQ